MDVDISAGEIVTILRKELTKLNSGNAVVDWASQLYDQTLDEFSIPDLIKWGRRRDKGGFTRYNTAYSPEWLFDHMQSCERLIEQAAQLRRDYMQLESQGLSLVIQYAVEVSQRPYLFMSTKLQAREAAKVLKYTEKQTQIIIDDLERQEAILAEIHNVRQKLHLIPGGALNFLDRLREIRSSYVVAMQELLDRSETVYVGLRSTMKFEVAAPPELTLEGKLNPVESYREWIDTAKRKLGTHVNAECSYRFLIMLRQDGIIPDLLERLAAMSPTAGGEFRLKIKFPDLAPQYPVGIIGMYPVIVSDSSEVKSDDINKENSFDFPIRIEKRNNDKNRQLRASAKATITPPYQGRAETQLGWQPTARLYQNIPFVNDKTVMEVIERSRDLTGGRLDAQGEFVISFSGQVQMGETQVAVRDLINPEDRFSEAKILDIAVVVDAVYRGKPLI